MTAATLSLESRLRRMEACEAIRTAIYTYAMAGDRGNDPDIVRGVFTADAVYEAVGMTRLEGLENIVNGLARIGRDIVVWSFHAPSGPLIELNADASRATAFWWVWVPVKLKDNTGTAKPHWGAGQYNASLVDAGEGVWKFTQVLFETRLRAPFEGPWTDIEGPFRWPT